MSDNGIPGEPPVVPAEGTDRPESAVPPRPRRWVAPVVVAGIVLLALVAYGIYLVVWWAHGETVRQLEIRNVTSTPVSVSSVSADGVEFRFIDAIPPHSDDGLPGECFAGELVARTEDGRVIERRGPFEDCNLTPWTIGDGVPG